MFRKFFMWLVKSLIVVLLTILVFSSLTLSLPTFVKGIFKDFFQYADAHSQKEVINKLSQFCSDLGNKDTQSTQQELSKRGISMDFGKLGSLCEDYKNGTISQNEFFFKTIETTLPDKIELPKDTPFEKYNQAVNLAAQNKIIYVAFLIVLILILYLLAGTLDSFIMILSQLSFSMGTLILVPYILIIAYAKIIGISTTSILSTIFGSGAAFDIKAIISIVLLMILRTYTALIVILGAVFLAIGIIGKMYAHRLKKADSGTKKKYKSEDEELEEELDKKSKEKEKSMKEVLDELEEVQKKKKY